MTQCVLGLSVIQFFDNIFYTNDKYVYVKQVKDSYKRQSAIF